MTVWAETGFFTILNCLPMIIGNCANFLVIVSSLMFISVRDIEGTSLFLVSLSVADFMVCAVYQPLLVVRFNQPDQDRSLVLSTSFFGYSLITASLNGLLAVTFDRFVAIYLPFKYITWMNKTNVALLISISWLVALATGISILSEIFGTKVVAHFYITIIIVAVPILYGVIYKEARKQAQRIVNQSMPATTNYPKRRLLQADRATRGVGLVLITTLLCWMPTLLFPFFAADLKSDEDILRAKVWAITGACVNSCIKPFIYFYKFAKFRGNVRKLFQEIQRNVGGSFLGNAKRRRGRNTRKVHDQRQIGASRRSAWMVNENAIAS